MMETTLRMAAGFAIAVLADFLLIGSTLIDFVPGGMLAQVVVVIGVGYVTGLVMGRIA